MDTRIYDDLLPGEDPSHLYVLWKAILFRGFELIGKYQGNLIADGGTGAYRPVLLNRHFARIRYHLYRFAAARLGYYHRMPLFECVYYLIE